MGGPGSGRTGARTSRDGRGGTCGRGGGGESSLRITSMLGFNKNTSRHDKNEPQDKEERHVRIVSPAEKERGGTTRTSMAVIPKMMIGDELTKPPVEKPMILQVEKKVEAITGTTYKFRICYRQKVRDRQVDVLVKMKAIMARLMQYEKSVQLIPFDPSNKSNPIVNAKDIPSDEQDFEIYIPSASVYPKSMTLHMNFRIASDKRLWKLKMIVPIRNYLTKFAIYLDENILVTIDNAKVGGLVLSHSQFTRRDQAVKDLYIRLNENEKVKIPLQLTPFVLYNGNGAKKISTKLLSVECYREHVPELRSRLFIKLIKLPPSLQYSNTRLFKFIPFNATGAMTDRIIRKGMYLQNKYLLQCTNITLLQVHSVEWIVPNWGGLSFQAVVLEAMQDKELDHIFNGVEMGASENKVHLLTTKNILEQAETWVDNFVAQMKQVSERTEFWKNTTGFDGPPVRIGQTESSDAHKAYANYIDQSFTSLVGTEVEQTAPKTQPKRHTYSSVVYGDDNGTHTSTITQTTENSTVSSGSSYGREIIEESVKESMALIREDNKKELETVRSSMIEEMKQANNKASTRMEKMEKATECFDIMIRELHESNKTKTDAMEQYEVRLDQIGTTTVKTATKVDRIESKMDKSNAVMRQFIGVMAEVMGPNGGLGGNEGNQQNLRNLVNFLHEEEDAEDQLNVMFGHSTKNKTPRPTKM